MKDLISKRDKNKRISSNIPKYFDISMDDLDKALKGDLASCQKIADIGREAEIGLEIIPRIRDHIQNHLQYSEELNSLKAEYLKSAAQKMISIDKSLMQVSLQSERFENQRKEIRSEFSALKRLEKIRHESEMQISKMRQALNISIKNLESRNDLNNEILKYKKLEQKDLDRNEKLYLKASLDQGSKALPPAQKDFSGIKAIAKKMGLYL